MQFSYSWLKTQADTELSADKLEHLLTMSGLEVEEAETAAPDRKSTRLNSSHGP